jgi:hypothetical protein
MRRIYDDMIKSDVADIKNVGDGRWGNATVGRLGNLSARRLGISILPVRRSATSRSRVRRWRAGQFVRRWWNWPRLEAGAPSWPLVAGRSF